MTSVCVHGLGYIGLPTAAVLADAGHAVTGYDTDEAVRETVQNGDIHYEEHGLADLVAAVRADGALSVAAEVPTADYHLVCVPTPFDEAAREADLRYVRSAAQGIGEVLRADDVVVLESTVPPGTTIGPFLEALEAPSDLEAGADFSLAYSPETVMPGRALAELRTNDRLVGGFTDVSTEATRRLYESVVTGEIATVRDPTTAEFVKLLQNTYRDANVALANEIAKLADDYGIDARAAIEDANRHPRVDLLQPGPGVGGHCLPVDPWFLGHGSNQLDLVERAREINDGMPAYVADKVSRRLGSLDGRHVAVLGVAYKGNVDDLRGSPGIALAEELESHGGPTVALHDPHVSDSTHRLESLDGATRDADALVVTAAHDEYASLAPDTVTARMADDVVVDACDVLDRERWRDAGATVVTL
ncbi:nucleotide sugar dehydrogenase [Halovivax asiaticus JCM 14624]|uniref:UDP-N-acetyl-D-mannosamine dehydrogenase n=1 Tax=Halovivax asiaticus JCM 14624 TaxID=1227490 RepID=M0BJA2_9EURY|nr:nucleotide sugar dehydrogenase [Halovivax asiaticus]ELZ10971.1 nucleotide sugar dehydrogenase [Halovivax asiaticus JCM 14624]